MAKAKSVADWITVVAEDIVTMVYKEGDYYTDLYDEELAKKIETLIRDRVNAKPPHIKLDGSAFPKDGKP